MAGEKERIAMKYRKWDVNTKRMIVMDGLKGKPISEIRLEYQTSQTHYYRRRDKLLSTLPASSSRKEEAQAW